MKRTKTKTKHISGSPVAVLTADLHLTDTTPVSRIDDYQVAQANKLRFLQDLQREYGCPVLDAGDIFEHWKPSPWLLSQAYDLLPDDMVTIPGNHDLPEHSVSLYYKSGLAVLDAVGKLRVLLNDTYLCLYAPGKHFDICGIPYWEPIEKKKETIKYPGRKILILHEMVWPGKTPPWPGAEGISAIDILKQFHDAFDLILTGHHHTAFTVKYKESILVNPGPMMRSTVDKADYKPRCYLYFADDNSVEEVFYPIESGVHDDSHIVRAKEREERLESYIEKMNMEWDASIDFGANLESFFYKNKTPKKVRELIWEKMEPTI